MSKPFSLQIKHSNTDEWFTPPEAVRLILPFLRKRGYKTILCPFDKADSAFVRVLVDEGEAGTWVYYSHIEDGQDFFDYDVDDLRKFDAIVSNPPYSKREAVLSRLFEAGVPFAMLFNWNGLFDSRTRWQLFKDNHFELLIPRGRLRFSDGKRACKSPNFQSVFVCMGMTDNQIVFVEQENQNEAEK